MDNTIDCVNKFNTEYTLLEKKVNVLGENVILLILKNKRLKFYIYLLISILFILIIIFMLIIFKLVHRG